MKTIILVVIALVIIILGFDTLTSLHGAVVVSNGVECDDTMGLISNPKETASGDSIFIVSSICQRTPTNVNFLSKE